MTDYKPGTVAEIGWNMTSGRERAMFDGEKWWTESGCPVFNATDVRPLVVLDLLPGGSFFTDGCSDLKSLLANLRNPREHDKFDYLADQIEEQARMPRIPEPGLWGVVDAGVAGIPVRRWVHHEEGWWVADTGDRRRWEDLASPVLVRDGVVEGGLTLCDCDGAA